MAFNPITLFGFIAGVLASIREYSQSKNIKDTITTFVKWFFAFGTPFHFILVGIYLGAGLNSRIYQRWSNNWGAFLVYLLGVPILFALCARKVDHVVTIGSTSMQKMISEKTMTFEITTTVNLFPIMVDGTGMCGACRVTVGGASRFACVDGPDFNGHQVDFDELISRMRYYTSQEKIAAVLLDKGVIA